MADSLTTTIDLGGNTTAEVHLITDEETGERLIVPRVEEWPVTPAGARALAGALLAAADRAEDV